MDTNYFEDISLSTQLGQKQFIATDGNLYRADFGRSNLGCYLYRLDGFTLVYLADLVVDITATCEAIYNNYINNTISNHTAEHFAEDEYTAWQQTQCFGV